ncbi:hypothetical protein MJM83_29930, partial [Salmonella enterica subsp. enterica serovar Montevideo]|nr:hypothetical protein [Salmonella enterica subsp. enterica serovar Montevideo]
SMLGMWGCRVVAGYTLGIVLGMGVVGVWLGMFLDWAVRGALFGFVTFTLLFRLVNAGYAVH